MAENGLRISSSDLAALLERQILSGSVPPGAALPSERQLAERFGVSRTVVRETLRALSERRLVRIEVGRGMFVREPDPTASAALLANSVRGRNATARHVIRGRQVVEAATSRLAAMHHGAADLARLDSAIAAMRPQDSLLEQVQADLQFHLAVARASQNPVLEAMFGAISGLAAELMLRSLSDKTVAHEAVPQHGLILAAVRERDPDAADRHMREHLDVAMSRYGADLDENIDELAARSLRERAGADRSLDDIFGLAFGSQG